MTQSTQERNKTLVLQAFDLLFNKRDYAAAEKYWSPHYIQHSAHIAPGREGLFDLVKSLPPTFKYEPGTIVAEGDFVIVHGRFSGFGAPANWIAADIVRIQNGILVDLGYIDRKEDPIFNSGQRQSRKCREVSRHADASWKPNTILHHAFDRVGCADSRWLGRERNELAVGSGSESIGANASESTTYSRCWSVGRAQVP